MLDEFPAIGRLSAVERALPYCAGYGIKVYLITQALKQLTDVYGREQTVLANCHIRCVYAPNDFETAEAISKMLGNTTVIKKTKSRNLRAGGIFAAGTNESDQEVSRPLLTAAECMVLPATEHVQLADGRSVIKEPGRMLVFAAGHRPLLAVKAQHYDDPVLRRRAAIQSVPALRNADKPRDETDDVATAVFDAVWQFVRQTQTEGVQQPWLPADPLRAHKHGTPAPRLDLEDDGWFSDPSAEETDDD